MAIIDWKEIKIPPINLRVLPSLYSLSYGREKSSFML